VSYSGQLQLERGGGKPAVTDRSPRKTVIAHSGWCFDAEDGYESIVELCDRHSPLEMSDGNLDVRCARALVTEFYDTHARQNEEYEASLAAPATTFWKKFLCLAPAAQPLPEPRYRYLGCHLGEALIQGGFLPLRLIPQFNLVAGNCAGVSEVFAATLQATLRYYTTFARAALA